MKKKYKGSNYSYRNMESRKETKKPSNIRLSPTAISPMQSSVESVEVDIEEEQTNKLEMGNMSSIFEILKSNDPSHIIQAVIELSSELSMAQETTIESSLIDQLVIPLTQCLKMEEAPDIVCMDVLVL